MDLLNINLTIKQYTLRISFSLAYAYYMFTLNPKYKPMIITHTHKKKIVRKLMFFGLNLMYFGRCMNPLQYIKIRYTWLRVTTLTNR